MIRIVLILILVGLALWGLVWGLKWLLRNRARIQLRRLPTNREVLFFSMFFRLAKVLLRLLLRR